MEHSIGQTISKLRKQKGWTQIELAEKLQVSDKAVSKWEKDNGLPSIEFFPALSRLFNVTIDYLMSEIETDKKTVTISKTEEKEETNINIDYRETVQQFVDGDIIDLEKLFSCGNYDFIKTALNEYSVYSLELLCKYFTDNDKRKFFQFAVDNELNDLVSYILKNDLLSCEKWIVKEFNNWIHRRKTIIFKNNLNCTGKYLEIIDTRTPNLFGVSFTFKAKSVDDILEFFNKFKLKHLNTIKPNYNKDAILKELNKQYFYKQLKNNNIENIIIKLCVRLESVLKSFYEGSFEELLNQYCSQGKCTHQEAILLNKLRKHRNNLVHPEKTNDKLSTEEMIYCIDYICELK